MNSIMPDLRYALRQLRKAPTFALTAVVTLALGIGANTAIFTVFDQVLLRVLPVEKPGQLVAEDVELELTFDPPWTPDRMSDDAKFITGAVLPVDGGQTASVVSRSSKCWW